MKNLSRLWRWLNGNEQHGFVLLDKTGDDARRELAAQAARCTDMRTEFTPQIIARTQRCIVRHAEFDRYRWDLYSACDGDGNVIGQFKREGY